MHINNTPPPVQFGSERSNNTVYDSFLPILCFIMKMAISNFNPVGQIFHQFCSRSNRF